MQKKLVKILCTCLFGILLLGNTMAVLASDGTINKKNLVNIQGNEVKEVTYFVSADGSLLQQGDEKTAKAMPSTDYSKTYDMANGSITIHYNRTWYAGRPQFDMNSVYYEVTIYSQFGSYVGIEYDVYSADALNGVVTTTSGQRGYFAFTP